MLISFGAGWTSLGRWLKNNGKMLQSYGLWLDDQEFNVCQIDVLCGKSLIIDFLENFFKKRTAIRYMQKDTYLNTNFHFYFINYFIFL